MSVAFYVCIYADDDFYGGRVYAADGDDFAFVMGIVLEEYEEKRREKMKYFE